MSGLRKKNNCGALVQVRCHWSAICKYLLNKTLADVPVSVFEKHANCIDMKPGHAGTTVFSTQLSAVTLRRNNPKNANQIAYLDFIRTSSSSVLHSAKLPARLPVSQ